MNGKIFVWLLAIIPLTAALPTEAQQPTKVPRIGYLSGNSLPLNQPAPRHSVRGCASWVT